jgi:hypothetical protein
VCAYIFKQIRHNDITEECIIIVTPFGHIGQIVDSVDRPNNRNEEFFRVIFVFDSFWNLISGRDSYRLMKVVEIKIKVVAYHNLSKAILLIFFEKRQKARGK